MLFVPIEIVLFLRLKWTIKHRNDILVVPISKKEAILQSGLEGEQTALAALAATHDDTWHLFTNLRVPYGGKVSETDIIAVGPSGVSIYEVKNYSGCLRGDWSDEHLTQIKNERYSKSVYNPVKQVGTHVYRLANFLRDHGIKTKVVGCEYFTDGTLDVESVTDRHNKHPNIYQSEYLDSSRYYGLGWKDPSDYTLWEFDDEDEVISPKEYHQSQAKVDEIVRALSNL